MIKYRLWIYCLMVFILQGCTTLSSQDLAVVEKPQGNYEMLSSAITSSTEMSSISLPTPVRAIQEITMETINITGGRVPRDVSSKSAGATRAQPKKLLFIDDSNNSLSVGNAAYHVPRYMSIGNASRVDLWIDSSMSVEALQSALAKSLSTTMNNVKIQLGKTPEKVGTVIGLNDVYVGLKMVAQLRGGDDFTIEPSGPISKSLLGDGRAMWDWRVTPKRYNANGLTLIIDTWVDVGANKDAFPSIQETIIVPSPSIFKKLPETLDVVSKSTDSLNKLLTLLGVVGGIGGIIAMVKKYFKPETPSVPPAS